MVEDAVDVAAFYCRTIRWCWTSSLLEHLWETVNALLGERDPGRTPWVAERLEQLLAGQTAAGVAGLEQEAEAAGLTKTQQEVLRRTAGYYRRNAPYMDYPAYLAQG